MKWTKVLVAAGAVLMTSCTPLSPVRPETVNNFALETCLEKRSGETAADAPVVLVSPARARAGFDGRRMAYVRKAHELEYFSRNQWVDTPARMLTPLLAQALESSGAFRAVLLVPGTAHADLRLESEVVRLQQEFLASPSQVRLGVRIQLVDVGNRKVLATREFEYVETAASDDPYGGVVAANRAVGRLLGELAEFSVEQVKNLPP